MSKRYTIRLIATLSAIVISLILLAIVCFYAPQNYTSASVIDLIVNNLVNILIAVGVTLLAVQHYESKRQRVTFIIDLLKKTDALCDSMKKLAISIRAKPDPQNIAVNLYCSYAKSLSEYTNAIEHQILQRKSDSKEFSARMYKTASDHMNSLFDATDETIKGNDEAIEIIDGDELQTILEVQTYIPKILGDIKY